MLYSRRSGDEREREREYMDGTVGAEPGTGPEQGMEEPVFHSLTTTLAGITSGTIIVVSCETWLPDTGECIRAYRWWPYLDWASMTPEQRQAQHAIVKDEVLIRYKLALLKRARR